MSTEIKKIKGRYETDEISKNEFEAIYGTSEISLTRFAGGKEAMLQITINRPDTGYVQLTRKQVRLLVNALINAFNYKKHP